MTEPARWSSETPTAKACARAPPQPLLRHSAERLCPPAEVGGGVHRPLYSTYSAMGPKRLFRRQASSGAGQRARTAGWGISSPSWGGHPTLVPLLTPTPQFGKTRIPVGDGAQPCRALERPRGREWAAGANRGTRTSACPDIAPLACTTNNAGEVGAHEISGSSSRHGMLRALRMPPA